MVSPNGRFVVSFNGEILNHRELCEEWQIDRRTLRSSSDTEILLIGWERFGRKTLESLVGPFAIAMYDSLEHRLWLVRDRLGERPLFYHQSTEGLTFGSTIEAVLQAPWVAREFDPIAVEELVTLRYVCSPRSIMRHVQKLPPGYLLVTDANQAQVEPWWQPRFGSEQNGSRPLRGAPRAAEFDRLLTRAVNRCTIADVPVGLLISDGIDSNAITHALRGTGCATRQYTFRAEMGTAEEVHVHQEGPIQIVEASRAARSRLMHEALGSVTEPVGDGALLATWLLLREASKSATVLLAGHGGDEVCGGYRLSQDRFRLSMLRYLARVSSRLGNGIYERYSYGAGSVAERRAALARSSARLVPAAAHFIVHQPLSIDDVLALSGDLSSRARYLAPVDRFYQECADENNDLERMQRVLLRGFLGENILSFVDSVAMAHSVEGRMPFLDRDLVEFSLAAPSTARVGRLPGYTNTKKELRRWAKPRLDESIVRRHKRSFPYGALRQLLDIDRNSVLAPLQDSTVIHRALPGLRRWLDHEPDFFRGPRDGTLWALLSLASWSDRVGITP